MTTTDLPQTTANETWFRVRNEDEIASPALLLYRERVEANLAKMIEIAGGPERLRPHVKTHKLGPLVQAQVAAGITKYKCATIAEVAMAAEAGGTDVLLAYPPVGPAGPLLVRLQQRYPKVAFSAIADSREAVEALSAEAIEGKVTLGIYLDLDCGMHRTGLPPGEGAVALYRLISDAQGLRPAGLHAYDGHIHDSNVTVRKELCEQAFASVLELRARLEGQDLPVPTLIAGGSPTFAIHATHPDRELSPGTTVLWDFGYAEKYPDLPFLPAALLLTRVISKPGPNRLCLDLGHKAVASESPAPRVRLLDLPDAEAVMHSEEHLVVETPRAEEFQIGQCLYAIPRHICPTVALHDVAWVIEDGVARQGWRVTARDRQVTI